MRAVLLVFLLALSGCVSAAAINQAKTEQAVNRGHANDVSLPAEARLIADDNYDAWSAQLYNLCGERLPSDVEARLRANSALPDGYNATDR